MKTWEGFVIAIVVAVVLILTGFLLTGHADLLLCGHHSVNGKTC